jgi:hypothetical protein
MNTLLATLQEIDALRMLLSFEDRTTIQVLYMQKIAERRNRIIHLLN